MIKTQVQLPDELYYKAKAIAEQREWSLAEIVRRGNRIHGAGIADEGGNQAKGAPCAKEWRFSPRLPST
jgi:hypothetical protein